MGGQVPGGIRERSGRPVLGVRAGDKVEEGQLLLQTESADIVKDLSAAQARLETASLRLQQAQAQSQAQRTQAQRDASRRVADETARRHGVMLVSIRSG